MNKTQASTLIKETRDRLGKNQTDFGAEWGELLPGGPVSKQAVSQWEAGGYLPDLYDVALAKITYPDTDWRGHLARKLWDLYMPMAELVGR